MNKTPRLSNSNIEYLDKVWNFSSGCGNGCGYCYAKKITKRFTNHYPNEFVPTLYPEALLSPLYLKKPSRIGVCYMGDLFWDCPEFDPDRKIESTLPSQAGSVRMSLKGWITTTIEQCPQHTFVFLTKQPQNLLKFSPFPENCWVGVTATDTEMYNQARIALWETKASIKYLSFEPLLSKINMSEVGLLNAGIKQVIIGAQTKPTVMPKIEWIREIVEAADKAGIPVFLKDNLIPLFIAQPSMPDWARRGAELRQELPQ